MEVSANITSRLNVHEVQVETDGTQKELSISPKAAGYGSSVNGAELLLASIATCFCNDIYREANKRAITIHGVNVTATGEFGDEGEPGSNFKYSVEVKSEAPEEAIRSLIQYVDGIAEIHKTLRKGIAVTLR